MCRDVLSGRRATTAESPSSQHHSDDSTITKSSCNAIKDDSEDDDEDKHQISLTFQPGPLGIELQEDIVSSVQRGSQAELLCVVPGWKVQKLNGEVCSFLWNERIKAAITGGSSYEVTFKFRKRDMAGTHEDVPPLLPQNVSLESTSYDSEAVSDLESKLRQQEHEANAIIAEMDEKAQKIKSRVKEMELRWSQTNASLKLGASKALKENISLLRTYELATREVEENVPDERMPLVREEEIEKRQHEFGTKLIVSI